MHLSDAQPPQVLLEDVPVALPPGYVAYVRDARGGGGGFWVDALATAASLASTRLPGLELVWPVVGLGRGIYYRRIADNGEWHLERLERGNADVGWTPLLPEDCPSDERVIAAAVLAQGWPISEE